MNSIWSQKEFCADLTREIASNEELTLLCARTVQVARRRRRIRRVRAGVFVLALAAASLMAVRKQHPLSGPTNIAPTEIASAPAQPPFRLIRSQTFTRVITSEPFR